MSDNNKVINKVKSIDKPKEVKKLNIETLRFMSTDQLNDMQSYIVGAHQKAFDLYFMIEAVKKSNKLIMQEKPDAESIKLEDDNVTDPELNTNGQS